MIDVCNERNQNMKFGILKISSFTSSSAISEDKGEGPRTQLIINTPMGKPEAVGEMTIQGMSHYTLQVKGDVGKMFRSDEGDIKSFELMMDGDVIHNLTEIKSKFEFIVGMLIFNSMLA